MFSKKETEGIFSIILNIFEKFYAKKQLYQRTSSCVSASMVSEREIVPKTVF